ncbi:MAG: response regulator [Cytophagia bacterium]|nr:response regulator [Cytophagia bacterium]
MKYGIRHIKLALRAIVCLLLLCLVFNLKAQHKNVRFQHLTIEDGLAQNMVDCMLQDSQGFMWFGTWNGLSRFDGYNFQTYNTERNDSEALGNNFVYSLVEDAFGNLWVGTREGLYVYLYNQDKFEKATNLFDGDASNLNARIHSLAVTEGDLLLVGTENGLLAFNVLNEQAQITNSQAYNSSVLESLRGKNIRDLLLATDGQLWAATNNGVFIIDKDGKKLENLQNQIRGNGLSSSFVQSLFQDSEGFFWIGTDFGLNRYDPANREVLRFLHDLENPKSLPHNAIMDILEDGSGRLLIATLGGLSIVEGEDFSFTNHKNEFYSEHSLTNNFVNSLTKDENGNIWVGTERGGVSFYNINQNIFEHFEFSVDDDNSLSNRTVNSIFEDDKYLWVGTAGGGLDRYNPSTGRFKNYTYNSQNVNSLSSEFITGVLRDNNGQLWVSSWGAGLNQLINEGEENERFIRYQSNAQNGLTSSFVSSMTVDADGYLWVGTLSGLFKFDIDSGVFEQIRSEEDNQSITEVGCLEIDSEGNLWVGTRIGLYKLTFDQEGNTIQKFTHDPNNAFSISGNYVISVKEDADGDMWFGTYGQGLNLLRKGSDKFEVINTDNGLSNNIIYGIQQDNEKNLWLSTDYGLSRLNPQTRQVRNFYISDGLLNNQYYWSASFKNKEGKLYFGGMMGMDAFYADWIKDVNIAPKVVITDLKLFNESITPQKTFNGVEVIDTNPSRAKEVNLSYREKNFGIEFSSLNYQEPEMIRYAYILDGFEKEWNYVTSDRRYASYTNLKPGEYTFKVKASGANGEFGTETTEVKVIIAPPFWDTAWFKGLMVVLLAGAVFGYNRWRTYNLKRQKLILEAQVKERTERINRQKEALAAQALELKDKNEELEEQQSLIAGQNQRLEHQNKEITTQHNKLKELNKKLNLVSRLRLSFFTNISHEFRTPLTLIIGPLERLRRSEGLSNEVKNSLDTMHRNAQRLLHLINQIMDFRKIEKGKMELKVSRSNIADLTKDVFTAFESLATVKNITFNYKEKDVPTEVWFEARKMENILYNLLSNAFKYTPENGEVSLEVTGLTMKNSKLSAEDSTDDNQSVISIKVCDSGTGISKENLPLIFKRFYRIESEEAFQINGSGIGLALTEELIKAHHGDIFVDSELGRGSVFEVQLPCLKSSYESSEVIDKEPAGLGIQEQIEVLKDELMTASKHMREAHVMSFVYKKDRPTVLVVEDNGDLRRFMTHRLNETYNILEAPDGEEGIKLAKDETPDLIISDVMMPKVDGLELCTFIKSNLGTCHIPVILLTAKSSIEHQIQGYDLGADDYLAKPFNFDLLESRVQNLIDSRTALRHQFIQSPNFKVEKSTTNSTDEKFLTKAIEVVETHLHNPDFSVQEFVQEMHMSRSFLHNKLSALTNQSTAEFINCIRMKKALSLLQETERNISEVAYAVGYNDPKYFTRLFTKFYGESPKKYLVRISKAG